MKKIKFHICDVFSIEKNTGNQLAVFIDDGTLSKVEMQQMASEINFSESTFVNPNPNPDGSFNVRIFTPKSEIPFAGHPTLGTAFLINEKISGSKQSRVVLNLKAGNIPVQFEQDICWMQQLQPEFGKTFDNETFARLLNLETDEIVSSHPIEEASTGLPFTIVPLKSMESLKKAKINLTEYQNFIENATGKGILVFCNQGYTSRQQLAVRVFVPWLGIPEDPATGSAMGCLLAYLLKNNFYNSRQINLIAGQGYEINRPSELYLKASLENNNFSIHIGGKVNEVAEGIWMA